MQSHDNQPSAGVADLLINYKQWGKGSAQPTQNATIDHEALTRKKYKKIDYATALQEAQFGNPYALAWMGLHFHSEGNIVDSKACLDAIFNRVMPEAGDEKNQEAIARYNIAKVFADFFPDSRSKK